MSHRDAVRRFMADMQRRGEHPFDAAPPYFRVLWRCGARVRPPHYLTRGTIVLLLGGTFGLATSLLVGLLLFGLHRVIPIDGREVAALISVTLVVGLAFGLEMSRHYRRAALRLRLPPWETYLEE